VVWISHILIRHRDVPARALSFELEDWKAAPKAPERTREDAFAIARSIEERVNAAPEQFAQIARESSEDVATTTAGGSLGVYSALRLTAWPHVLDAVAAIEPGQVTRVVETEFGFHVFKRRPPPQETMVAGSRIVIGHDDAPWLAKHLSRRPVPQRSRAEALALAERVYLRARANPAEFSQLVDEFSEHRDAVRGGDFGQWSTRELTPFRQAVEILSQLHVGDVAPPVDSLFGYQIIQRTPKRKRMHYSVSSIKVSFDPTAGDAHPDSRASAYRRLQPILETLRVDPRRFPEFQRQLCCIETESWTQGRGGPLVEQSISLLRPDEVALHVVEEDRTLWILRRLEEGDLPPTTTSFELPNPEHADVEQLVVHSGWLAEFADAWHTAQTALHLTGEDDREFIALHAIEEPMRAAQSEAQRVAIYRDLQRRVGELLGPTAYARYSSAIEEALRARLMAYSASSR
jgi:hypothetical protein